MNSSPVQYLTRTPVLFLVFNRIDTTKQVFEKIRQTRPPRLYVAADGARFTAEGENEKVATVRNYILSSIDWDCDVRTLFRETNLGCKKAVEEAITWFFENEEMGIIIEDDCAPTPNFFRFCEWALNEYEDNKNIGLVSGSNLVDYKFISPYRNGFSRYINIWGWATWRDRWSRYNSHLSLTDLIELDGEIKRAGYLRRYERIFWKNVFKHTITFQTTWDFYLQYQFFKEGFYSVFPSKNLILNIGFGPEGTHTTSTVPDYWKKSKPKVNCDIMMLPVLEFGVLDIERDREMTATIWNCTPLRTLRLLIMNVVRYMNI